MLQKLFTSVLTVTPIYSMALNVGNRPRHYNSIAGVLLQYLEMYTKGKKFDILALEMSTFCIHRETTILIFGRLMLS